MKKKYNIAVVGLGQIGSYLLNELNIKKRIIEVKTGVKINNNLLFSSFFFIVFSVQNSESLLSEQLFNIKKVSDSIILISDL